MNDAKEISNTEWGLVIGALALIDLGQILLDVILVGEFVNPFIDVCIGLVFPFYLKMRGQNLTDTKRLLGILGAFLFEGLTLGALPLWTLDGIYNFVLYKADKKINQEISKVPGGNIAVGALEKKRQGMHINDRVRQNKLNVEQTREHRSSNVMPIDISKRFRPVPDQKTEEIDQERAA